MNVLEKLIERATQVQRYNEFMRKPVMAFTEEAKTGQIRSYTTDRNEEYPLR